MNNAGEKVLMHYSWPGSTSETYSVTYNTLMLDNCGLVLCVNRLANLQFVRGFMIVFPFGILDKLKC